MPCLDCIIFKIDHTTISPKEIIPKEKVDTTSKLVKDTLVLAADTHEPRNNPNNVKVIE